MPIQFFSSFQLIPQASSFPTIFIITYIYCQPAQETTHNYTRDEQAFLPSYNPIIPTVMETGMSRRPHQYTKRLAAISLGVLAVVSPLYVDKVRYVDESDDDGDDEAVMGSWVILPIVLVSLIVAINLANLFDRRYFRFDPYWIHRVGGSSFGIGLFLFLLALILNFKSSF